MSDNFELIVEELPPIRIVVPVENEEDDPEMQESSIERRIRYILNFQEGI